MIGSFLHRRTDGASLLARQSPEAAARRLRRILGIFFICLLMPLYVLISLVRNQIEIEAAYESRAEAEELLARVNEGIQKLLAAENERPFGDYSFVNIAENRLLQQPGVSLSPLAEITSNRSIPGLIGYFQINPDGSFHTPVLPDISSDAFDYQRFGWSKDEYDRRLQLRDKLHRLLLGSALAQAAVPRRVELAQAREEQQCNYRSLSDMLVPAACAQTPPPEQSLSLSGAARSAVKDSYKSSGDGAANQIPLSPKKLSEYNINQRPWSQGDQEALTEQRPAEPAIQRRKEKVILPESKNQEQEFELLLNRGAENKELKYDARVKGGKATRSSTAKEERASAADEEAKASVGSAPEVTVLTTEGEIDPLQLRILEGGKVFAFYRKAWPRSQRYIQGFLCDADEFLGRLIGGIIENSRITAVSGLVIGHNGEIFRRLSLARAKGGQTAPSTDEQSELYRHFLMPPLDSLEFVFTVREIPLGPVTWLVDFLVVCFSIVVLAGLGGIYRLGVGHIKFASERSNFVSAVSHELRTPLTSIRMYAEMLRSGWLVDEARRKAYYDYIFFESERLSRLIANILHLSKLTHAAADLELKEYGAGELLRLIKNKVSSQIEAAGYTLMLLQDEKCCGEELIVLAEEDSVARIFINLVDNAIKFSGKAEKKVIELGLDCSHNPGMAAFFVRDYGPGIESGQISRVFELFYRGQDELTRTTPGTGIGLALVKELACKLGAQVTVANREPGAEFRVCFRVQRTPPI